PCNAPVTWSISRIPGPPRGPSYRMTMKSPALIFPALMARNASSSRLNTRARPRKVSSLWPASLATQPSGARLPLRMARPPWRARRPARDPVELVDVELNTGFLGEGEQVEDGVGGAAGRHHAGDRVVQRLLGDDLAREHPLAEQVHHHAASLERDLRFLSVGRGHVVEAHRRDAEHLERGGHRVGGELSAAGALARTGRALDGVELVGTDLSGVARADG